MILEIGPVLYLLIQQILLTVIILTFTRAFVALLLNDVGLEDIPLIWRKTRGKKEDTHLAE